MPTPATAASGGEGEGETVVVADGQVEGAPAPAPAPVRAPATAAAADAAEAVTAAAAASSPTKDDTDDGAAPPAWAVDDAQRAEAAVIFAAHKPSERGQLSPAAAWRALATTGLGNDVDGDGELNADEARGRRACAAFTCVWCVRAVTR